jgi:hypothetical protein
MTKSMTNARGLVMIAASVVAAASLASFGGAETVVQTDWAEGPGKTVVAAWGGGFSEVDGVSWRAVSGQLVLSSTPLDQLQGTVVEDSAGQPASLAVVDVDGDGDRDVLGADFEDGTLAWWRNDGGDADQWTRLEIAAAFTQAASIRAADVDGDGDPDIVAAALGLDEISWWENTGADPAAWIRRPLATGFAGAHWVELVDLDQDGDVDVLGAAAGVGGGISWFESDGAQPPTWMAHPIDAAFAGARAAVAGDIDGDGILDVVGAALTADEVAWWRHSDDGASWTKQVIGDGFNGAHGVAVVDLDDDGDLDVVAAAFFSARFRTWRNDGGAPIVWVEDDLPTILRGGLTIDSGDLDGDGDLDLAGAAETDDRVVWWPNIGGPVGDWQVTNVATAFDGAWPVVVADVDDDGALDLVAGAGFAGRVEWWRLGAFRPSGALDSSVLDTGGDVVSIRVELEAEVPDGALVGLEVRWSVGGVPAGSWQTIAPGEVLPVPIDARYLQYRLRLESSDPERSPIVREIRMILDRERTEPPRRGGRRL